jgi:hypothetical protein
MWCCAIFSRRTTAAVNLSPHDRIAVYFRIWLKGIEQRRLELLTDIWIGWRI